MCSSSPGIMGQLVACGPVEGQGQGWLAQGRQVPSSIFYPPSPNQPAHASPPPPKAITLIPQAPGPHPPEAFLASALLSLVASAVGTLSAHPQFRATLTKVGRAALTPLPTPLCRRVALPAPGGSVASPVSRVWRQQGAYSSCWRGLRQLRSPTGTCSADCPLLGTWATRVTHTFEAEATSRSESQCGGFRKGGL